jgi:Sugar (and other) transporter
MTSWGFKLLVALTFPLLVEALGAASTVYRAASVSTLVFWHRFVPERKGWSLEEIIVDWCRFR